MKTENYINKIIEETGLTRKEIQDRVEEKKAELKGLISDEGALFIIAKELGINVQDENKDLLKDIEINICDITPNMKNITLIGRIKDIYNVNSFNRNDGSIGYVGSFLLSDNTGDIRIVLWDDDTNILKNNNFEINELVKIINGYAKKGKYGDTQIHLGRFGKIIVTPEDIDYRKYPKIKSEHISINKINLSQNSVSIEGKIIQKFPMKEFTRKNGETGKVSSLTLMDSTGSIRITFWNENTKKIKDFEVGDSIEITNLNPRLSNLDSKTIDLFANNSSIIKRKDKEVKIEGDMVDNIKLLQDMQKIVSFQGIISSIDNLKKVNLKSGEAVSLLSFIVSDDTDGIRTTLWREKAEEFSESLKVGTGILLKNVLIKYSSFSDRNEISLIKDSSLEIIDLKIKGLKDIEPQKKGKSKFTENYSKISSINSSNIIEIKGFIAKELKNVTIYEACPNCFKKIDNCSCDEKGESEYRMILNLTIDDESGTIRTTFMGDIAEKLIGEKTDILQKLKETPDFDRFLEKKSAEIIGRDIIIKGRTRFSDFSKSYEINVYDFKDVNVNDELEKVMREIET